jgi:hypothetical protein
VKPGSHGLDRIDVTLANSRLVAIAGACSCPPSLVDRPGLERPINATLNLSGRVGAALPGHMVLIVVHTMAAGGSHVAQSDP